MSSKRKYTIYGNVLNHIIRESRKAIAERRKAAWTYHALEYVLHNLYLNKLRPHYRLTWLWTEKKKLTRKSLQMHSIFILSTQDV